MVIHTHTYSFTRPQFSHWLQLIAAGAIAGWGSGKYKGLGLRGKLQPKGLECIKRGKKKNTYPTPYVFRPILQVSKLSEALQKACATIQIKVHDRSRRLPAHRLQTTSKVKKSKFSQPFYSDRQNGQE